MATVHPSRQRQVPNAAVAPPVAKVTLTARAMCDHGIKPLVIGERNFFNHIRCNMVKAVQQYMVSASQLNQQKTDHFTMFWLGQDETIQWHNMPRAFDVQQMAELTRAQMVGAYWFINHDDTDGTLSQGQVFDLLASVSLLRNELDGQQHLWPPRLYNDMMNFLKQCVDFECIIEFSIKVPQSQPLPQLDIGNALRQLQPLIAEPYNPAAPAVTGR